PLLLELEGDGDAREPERRREEPGERGRASRGARGPHLARAYRRRERDRAEQDGKETDRAVAEADVPELFQGEEPRRPGERRRRPRPGFVGKTGGCEKWPRGEKKDGRGLERQGAERQGVPIGAQRVRRPCELRERGHAGRGEEPVAGAEASGGERHEEA